MMETTPMPPPGRDHLHLSRKAFLRLTAGALLLVALVAWLVMHLNPLPPRTLTLACGPEGSSYAVFGKRYQKLLAKQGLKLNLIATKGSAENLELLAKPYSGIDLGFVDGGIGEETDDTSLESLGTLGYEPLWYFSRKPTSYRALFIGTGRGISVGPVGSESRALVASLLKRSRRDIKDYQFLDLPPEASAAALLAGRIDGAIFVNSYASPLVRQLAVARGIQLVSSTRADAFVARLPSLTKRVFPAGVADLAQDRPSHDVILLATRTSLVVRGDLHPALKYALLEMLSQVHGRSGIFQKAGEFPAADALEFPLAREAQHFYKSGQPVLQRYLPFWLAVLVEELVLLLIPVLGLSYPLIKGLMWAYGWGMQRRIFLLYGELHWLDLELEKLEGRPAPPELKARLASLELRAKKLRVAAKYMPMLYNLKETVAFVRARVEKAPAGSAS